MHRTCWGHHQGPETRSTGQSNAAADANSVLGARTQKYPDYLDAMIAITGWAPNANCHTGSGRVPALCIGFPELDDFDNSL